MGDVPNEANKTDFVIVGIGASAGGLEAFEGFFTNLPSDTGMAYIVIQHLDPTHESMLHEILKRYTDMDVSQAENEVQVEPDHVYIIPPNRDMAFKGGKLILTEPDKPRGFRLPIDFFFRSLAAEQGEKAVGIVLSGTASDGTLGVKAIKGAGGMAMAQDPQTARYTGMPENAIATSLIDYILSPEQMPGYLVAYVERVIRRHSSMPVETFTQTTDFVQGVFELLRVHTGHDFAQYKPNTIGRRIERRMAVSRQSTLEDYVRYLKQTPPEVEILFKELLIGVTRFFRDEDAFKYLVNRVLPEIIESKKQRDTFRVWVTGCSTGEEAYTIAILIYEAMGKANKTLDVQIFATDIDLDAIETARTALYPDNIMADIPPDIFKRHFTKVQKYYRVKKHIRDMVIFAEQSLIKDPPFSRLDFISCRNLLIYLNLDLQKRVIQLFHYALVPDGHLFLGTSESLASYDHLFDVVNKKWKIYKRLEVDLPRGTMRVGGGLAQLIEVNKPHEPAPTPTIQDIARQAILDRYPYPAVIVDKEGEILFFHGNTSDYLTPPSGEASFKILNMVHEKLRPSIRDGLRTLYTQQKEVSQNVIRIQVGDQIRLIRLVLQPLHAGDKGLLTLVVFEDEADTDEILELVDSTDETLDEKDRRIIELQQELRSTKEYLQTTIEELETANEELKSVNEELQSSNEEFQSTNEELETTKEELQSVNEELITVNNELTEKIDELRAINTHQANIMDSMNSGLIFLNEQLEIEVFNPIARDLLNLVPHDIGRPVRHFASNMEYPDFINDCEHVLNTLKFVKHEIHSTDGRWFVTEIQPYRTLDGDVAGLIVTFMEISEEIQLRQEIRQQQHLYRTLAQHLPDTVVLLFDHELRFVVVEGQGLQILGLTTSTVEGKSLQDVIQVPENLKTLTKIYQETLVGEQHRLEVSRDDITFLIRTTPVYDENNEIRYGLLVGTDISEQRHLEQELEQSEEIYRTIVQHYPNQAIFVFDADLRYIFAGGSALQNAGFVGDEMVGHTLYEVLVPERAEKYAPFYEAALRGETVEFDSEFGERTYKSLAAPIVRDDGTVLAGMVISTEIQHSSNSS